MPCRATSGRLFSSVTTHRAVLRSAVQSPGEDTKTSTSRGRSARSQRERKKLGRVVAASDNSLACMLPKVALTGPFLAPATGTASHQASRLDRPGHHRDFLRRPFRTPDADVDVEIALNLFLSEEYVPKARHLALTPSNVGPVPPRPPAPRVRPRRAAPGPPGSGGGCARSSPAPTLPNQGEGVAERRPGPARPWPAPQLEPRRMVPVVRLARGDPPTDRITHHRNELLAPRIGWLLDLHQRHRIHARVGVAPVGLEAAQVGVDRPVEQPAGQKASPRLDAASQRSL